MKIKRCNECKSVNLKYIKNGYLECMDCGQKLDVFIAETITVYTQSELDAAVEAEREAIYKAFEPTSEMKAELIGEFKVNQPYWDGENECEEIQEISIPWTATKDIIKAVVKHVRLIRNKQ